MALYDKKHIVFPGRMVILGFGSIGQGVLPLFLRHIDMQPADHHRHRERGPRRGEGMGIKFIENPLTRRNLAVSPRCSGPETSWSTSRSRYRASRSSSCARPGARSTSTPASSRGRAATPIPRSRPRCARTMRARVGSRDPRQAQGRTDRGSDPWRQSGLVSHFVKQAMVDIADTSAGRPSRPDRAGWAALAPSSASRSSTSPSATPRSPPAQEARRVRQHLVDRRLRRRRQPAGRTRLGQP